MSIMVDKAMGRPADYAQRSLQEQWAIDEGLGILDWTPTPAEIEEFRRRWNEKYPPPKLIPKPTFDVNAKVINDLATDIKQRMAEFPRPEINRLFHLCWGNAKDSPTYNKPEWGRLYHLLSQAGVL